MAKQIIHGIGKAIVRDFADATKIVTMADLQDLSIESSSSTDDITGGNKIFPIASFKTDQSLTVSATNATFAIEMMPYLEGTAPVTGVQEVSDFMEVAVPANGEVTLEETPTNVVVVGFTKVTAEADLATGKFLVSAKKVTFDTADAGKVVNIVYDYNTSASAVTNSGTEKTMPKPFVFDYIFPIFDEDAQRTHKGFFKVYKAQCTAGLSISASHKGAFAPSFEASARDAKRADGKLWSLTIDGVVVA